MLVLKLSEVLIVGTASGFIGAVAGGGGLLSIPLLIFLGIPPQITLATNKFGGLGMSAGALFKFIREKKVVWKYAIGLSIAGILASFIGARVLVQAQDTPLNTMIGILLLLSVPLMLLRKDFGSVQRQTSLRMKVVGYILYFGISIIASFFGGIGSLLIAIVVWSIGLPMIEANATDLVGYTVMSISAVVLYAAHHLIDLRYGLVLFLGMLLGGYIGAHTAIKRGNPWVKGVFALVVIASAIKILLS